jgi:hypothetical protein
MRSPRKLALLLPSRASLAAEPATREGVLARWWSRADRLPAQAQGTEAMLRGCFEWPGGALPVAALTREFDGGMPDDAVWLRADPAHVRADMVTARLMACGDLGLSTAESDALLAALKPLFGDAGLAIEAGTPARWYVRCQGDGGLPTFVSPEIALGDDLRRHLPAGAAGRRWRALWNEVQVTLHHHPLNADRRARRLPAVNSVWFWGAGRRPERVQAQQSMAASNDALVQALAQRAGIACPAPGDDFASLASRMTGVAGEVLLDLRRVFGAALEKDWLVPLEQSLRRGGCDGIDLVFRSGERAEVRRRDRWRWWRAIRPLAA